MHREMALATFATFLTGLILSPARADIYVSFDGNYNFGIYDWWKTETDGWGDPPTPVEIIPGRGGTGQAQALVVYNGTHYVLKTMSGLTAGLDYVVSVWIRTYYGNGSPGVPGSTSWVEFGWDPQARDTTQPNSNLVWCVDPKFDFANNAGNWVKYSGEPFTATSDSITIAFKVGSIDNVNGIMAQFDDLEVVRFTQPVERFQFPDDFNATYTLGVAYGWTKRFIPGGITPRWEQGPGRTGSAQRLYAATDNPGWAISIGVVKLFEVEPHLTYRLNIWVTASDSLGMPLTDPSPDPGPVVKIGVDPTGQNADPEAPTIYWNTSPTDFFSSPSQNVGVWQQFSTPAIVTTTDTLSVWLWVVGDDVVGVDARFDDLDIDRSLDVGRWELYP